MILRHCGHDLVLGEPRTEQSTLTASAGELPADERPGFVGDLSNMEDPPRREAMLRDDLLRSVGSAVPLVLAVSPSQPLLPDTDIALDPVDDACLRPRWMERFVTRKMEKDFLICTIITGLDGHVINWQLPNP
jgi:hypothetical protein